MSVTKQDLHAEQKAHAVTRSLLDVARIDVMRLRSEVEALRGELGGAWIAVTLMPRLMPVTQLLKKPTAA